MVERFTSDFGRSRFRGIGAGMKQHELRRASGLEYKGRTAVVRIQDRIQHSKRIALALQNTRQNMTHGNVDQKGLLMA